VSMAHSVEVVSAERQAARLSDDLATRLRAHGAPEHIVRHALTRQEQRRIVGGPGRSYDPPKPFVRYTGLTDAERDELNRYTATLFGAVIARDDRAYRRELEQKIRIASEAGQSETVAKAKRELDELDKRQ